MEDHVLDLMIGEGPSARSIRIDLAPFTLVAATTRAGLLATPLRDRFGIPLRLEFYTPAELQKVLTQAAAQDGRWRCTADGAAEIAARARGTPRVAGRLLRRVRDFAAAEGADADRPQACAARALARLEVDELGLDALDRRYLRALIENYGGGPAGVETLAYAIAEARDAVEDVIEPFLLQQGFIQRTPRGRMACAKAYAHLGLTAPNGVGQPQPGTCSMTERDDRALRRLARRPRASAAGAHLLRGHRLHRRRLSRQLPALFRARPERLPPAGGRQPLGAAGAARPCAFTSPASPSTSAAPRGSTTRSWCAPPTTACRARACSSASGSPAARS